MPHHHPLTEKQVVLALQFLGFRKLKPKSGGHVHYVIDWARGKFRKVTVDAHLAPFSRTLIGHMANQAGISVKELYAAVDGKTLKNWP